MLTILWRQRRGHRAVVIGGMLGKRCFGGVETRQWFSAGASPQKWEGRPFVRLRREGNARRGSVAVAFVQIAAEGVRAAERSAVAGADAGVSPTIPDAAALALGCFGEREIGLCCFASREHAECRASDPREELML